MIIIMKKRMKSLWILVALLNVTFVKSGTFPECDLQSEGESVEQIHRINILDDQSGLVMTLDTTDVVSAQLAGNQTYNKYFILAFESNELTLSTSPEYVNIEQNEPSQSAETKLSLGIELYCGTEKKLFLDIVIQDNNNQPTEFSNQEITYNIPLPLPAKVPLYLFTDTPNDNKLTARDADISNDIITFEIDPSNVFDIFGEKDTRDPLGKTFVASIVAKMPLTKLPSNTFKITAKDKDARDPATMEITVKIDEAASLPASPVFKNKFYEAQYLVSDEGVHSLEVETLIIINPSSTYLIVAALDQGDIGDFFEVNYDSETKAVTLSKHADLTEDILDDNDFLTLWVQVKYEAVDIPSTSVSVLVTLPSKDQLAEPAFPESIYTAVYNKDTNVVTLDEEIIVTITDLDLKLKDTEFSTYFGIDFTIPPKVLILVEENIPQEILDEHYFITLVLSAKSTDGFIDYGETGLVINLSEKDCSIEPSDDIFVGTVFDGEYTASEPGSHTVTTVPISVVPEGVVVSIVGDYSRNFKVDVTTEKKVILSIKEELTEDIWNDHSYISILLQGTAAGVTGAARVILSLPEADCVIPEPEPSITFDVGPFILNPDASGKIGTLVATFDPPEDHTFAISKQPNWVLLVVGRDLNIAENIQLQPGTYRFTATVTGDTSDKKKDAQVTIYVKSSDPGEAKTKYSMIVQEILEEQVNEDILLLENEVIEGVNYEYVILSQEPEGPSFDIQENENNKKFLMSGIIDREDILFDGVEVPQVVLTISFQKENTTPNINTLPAVHPLFKHIQKSQNRDGQQCLMLHSEMLRQDHIMIVPVIILDKNDNWPVFSTESITIGYPSKDIVFDINPPYLLKVKATDKDDGGKAPITYATTSTSVKINPTTGIVYPTEGLYNGERQITFTASDGEQLADPPFVANVLLLDKDHISVLVFPDLVLEDLDNKLEELSAAIGVTLWSFSAGSLPANAKLRADSDVQLKVIVYAIDDDDDEAVSYEDLKEKLAGNAEVTIIEYIPGSTGTGSGDDPEECDDTGLIAGIAVLAVALVVCIVGFIAFYWKKRNSNASLDLEQIPENKTSFKKSNASQNGYNNEPILKDVSTRRATQHPMGTPKMDPDSSSINSSSSEDGEVFDEAKDRRKSVTFNENMQHFDITAKENETNLTKAIVD